MSGSDKLSWLFTLLHLQFSTWKEPAWLSSVPHTQAPARSFQQQNSHAWAPFSLVKFYVVRNWGNSVLGQLITGGRKQGTVVLHGWLWLLPTSTPSQTQDSSALTRGWWGKKATSLLKANFPPEKGRNEDALWTLLQPRIKVLKWNREMLKVLHRKSPKAKKQSSQLYWGIICLILRTEIP